MDYFVLVLGVIFFVLAIFGGLLAAAVYYLADKKNKQALVNQKQAKLEQAQADQRIEQLAILAEEMRDITGDGYAEDDANNLITIYADDEQPNKKTFVLATIYNKLGGQCAYRDVYAALQAYNEAAAAAGEEKLRLSEHRIREIINAYTFTSENNWPIIVIKRQQHKGLKSRWDETIDQCVIVPATTRGGFSKVMLPLSEVVDRVGGKVAQKIAANGRLSAANGQLSAVKTGLTASNGVKTRA